MNKLKFRGVAALRSIAGVALLVAATLASRDAASHHGWPQFDTSKPFFLAGTVKSIRWSNPHPAIVISVPRELASPESLKSVTLPKAESWSGTMMPALEVPAGLAPVAETGRDWTVILAPTTRLSDWGMKAQDIAVGHQVTVVGFAACDKSELEMRPEFIVLADRRAIRQRSVPLPATQCRR